MSNLILMLLNLNSFSEMALINVRFDTNVAKQLGCFLVNITKSQTASWHTSGKQPYSKQLRVLQHGGIMYHLGLEYTVVSSHEVSHTLPQLPTVKPCIPHLAHGLVFSLWTKLAGCKQGSCYVTSWVQARIVLRN